MKFFSQKLWKISLGDQENWKQNFQGTTSTSCYGHYMCNKFVALLL